jgi:hypothetical protein
MFMPSLLSRVSKFLCCVLPVLVAGSSATAAIREFPIPTIEKLGRELYAQMQRPQNLTEPQQRAKRAAMDALPQLAKQGYRFGVLSDPERKSYLVYGLATSRNPRDIVLGLHYRVSVSADGKVQRVDPLAWSAGVIKEGESGLPPGTTPVGFYTTCMVSNRPVETLVYLTLLHRQPCVVITHDDSTWAIENGKIARTEKKK